MMGTWENGSFPSREPGLLETGGKAVLPVTSELPS